MVVRCDRYRATVCSQCCTRFLDRDVIGKCSSLGAPSSCIPESSALLRYCHAVIQCFFFVIVTRINLLLLYLIGELARTGNIILYKNVELNCLRILERSEQTNTECLGPRSEVTTARVLDILQLSCFPSTAHHLCEATGARRVLRNTTATIIDPAGKIWNDCSYALVHRHLLPKVSQKTFGQLLSHPKFSK